MLRQCCPIYFASIIPILAILILNLCFYKCIKSKIITLKISRVAENGRTAMPTNKSATAKLTMKKLVTLLNLCEQKTAAMTRQLPTITNTFINAKNASDIKFSSSVHCTELISVQLLIARYNCVGMFDEFI